MWKQEYLKPFEFESDEPESDQAKTEAIITESIDQVIVATGHDIQQSIVRDQRYMP